MKKKELEIALEKLEGYRNPKLHLEQYTTPSSVAAELLNIASLKGDIGGKAVFDLGCGTGVLGIGAALLGAKKVVLADIDTEALDIARKNAEKFSLGNVFTTSDIEKLRTGDTVLQNPPFGVHRRGADMAFLKRALEIAPTVYTMHKRETGSFVRSYLWELGAARMEVLPVNFLLLRSYEFHEKEKKRIAVDVYRVRRN